MPLPLPLATTFPSPSAFIATLLRHYPAREITLILCTPRQALTLSLPRTLRTLSAARNIRVAFTPGMTALRALLAALEPRAGEIVAVWGAVEAHWESSEWSAAGLGRSVAGVVGVGGREVVFGEGRILDGDDEDRGWQEWFGAEIPVLIPTHVPLPTRTVAVERVLGRWVKVVREGEEKGWEGEGDGD